jgi:hypothetical protein
VLVTPTAPAFDKDTFEVTVPTVTGVTYKNKDTGSTLTTAAPVTLTAGQTLVVEATPNNSSFHFESNQKDQWTFKRPA